MVDQGTVIHQEFEEVKDKYPDLTLLEGKDGSWEIFGDLHFRGSFRDEIIEDVYSVLIYVPKSYPIELPSVKELGGRIPKDFHTSYDDTLCLGTPLRIKMRFYERPNLLGFVEACLIEYLYGYNYLQKHGELPTGEYSHGTSGVIEHYQDVFEAKQFELIFNLLEVLANNSYRGHHQCPCGSGAILRHCHGETLLDLMKYQTPEEYKRDLDDMRSLLRAALARKK